MPGLERFQEINSSKFSCEIQTIQTSPTIFLINQMNDVGQILIMLYKMCNELNIILIRVHNMKFMYRAQCHVGSNLIIFPNL